MGHFHMTKEEREALIEQHIEARTCWRCGKSTVDDLVYSIDGSHASCRVDFIEQTKADMQKAQTDFGIKLKRRAKAGEGKLAQRLMQLFEDAGYSPDCLQPAMGYWKHGHQDVMSWEIHLKINGYVYPCGCWETMTNFMKKATKYGFHINEDHEIWANNETPK